MLTTGAIARMLPAMGNIGQYVRLKRLEAGLSQRELARKADISPSAISMIERGERGRETSIWTISRICEALGLDTAEAYDILSRESRRHPAAAGV